MFFYEQQEQRETEQQIADDIRNTYDNLYNKQFIIDLFKENEEEYKVNEYVHLQLKTKNMLEFKNWLEVRCKCHPYLWEKENITDETQKETYLKSHMHTWVCIAWLFFWPKEMYISAIQWYKSDEHSWHFFWHQEESYVWNAPKTAYKQLTKHFWIPVHHLLFLVSSLFALYLNKERVLFIQDEYSQWSTKSLHRNVNASIAKKFVLQQDTAWRYRDREAIIYYISTLPENHQQVIFEMTDTLFASCSPLTSGQVLPEDIDNTTAQLIHEIRWQRKNK